MSNNNNLKKRTQNALNDPLKPKLEKLKSLKQFSIIEYKGQQGYVYLDYNETKKLLPKDAIIIRLNPLKNNQNTFPIGIEEIDDVKELEGTHIYNDRENHMRNIELPKNNFKNQWEIYVEKQQRRINKEEAKKPKPKSWFGRGGKSTRKNKNKRRMTRRRK